MLFPKAIVRGCHLPAGSIMMAAPLAAEPANAQTTLDAYTEAHGGGSEKQSGAGRKAMLELRKKEERAKKGLQPLVEGAYYTQSMWEDLVRTTLPCVQTLREVALQAKKKSDVPGLRVAQEFEEYVCCFAQQIISLIATHLPQSEATVRGNLRAIAIKEWLKELWKTEPEKPRPASDVYVAMSFTTSETKLQKIFAAVHFVGITTTVKVCHMTGVDFAWLKDKAQAFQTTVKINEDARWITCTTCLQGYGYQSSKGDASSCDCEMLCQESIRLLDEKRKKEPEIQEAVIQEPEKRTAMWQWLEDGRREKKQKIQIGLEYWQAEGCVLIQVRAPFYVTPGFQRDMYNAGWIPLVYN